MTNMTIKCKVCNRKPDEILEYTIAADEEGITPEDYVFKNEGTFNFSTSLFYCTKCYINKGIPLGTA